MSFTADRRSEHPNASESVGESAGDSSLQADYCHCLRGSCLL